MSGRLHTVSDVLETLPVGEPRLVASRFTDMAENSNAEDYWDSTTFELSQSFYFESAHSLARELDSESSRRIHGHTYTAEITVSGRRDAANGMVVDLGALRKSIDRIREVLDHRLLDEVPDLGAPTIENLCAFLWREFARDFTNLACVRVARMAGGDSCLLRKPNAARPS